MYKQKFLGMKKQVLFAMLLMAACCEKASPRNVTVDFPVSLNENGELSEGTISEDRFDNGNIEGWDIEGKCKTSNGVVEFYENAFDFHQTRTGLSNGWYQIAVNAFGRDRNSDGGTAHRDRNESLLWEIYGNDYALPAKSLYEETGSTGSDNGQYPFTTAEANQNFENGRYGNTVNVLVTDGTLDFGIRGKEGGLGRWCCFDNFKLTYIGNDLSALYQAMAEEALKNAGKISQPYKDKVKKTMDETSPSDETEVPKAISTLNQTMLEYIDMHNALAEAHSKETFEKGKLLLSISKSTDEARTDLESSLSTGQENLEQAISPDEARMTQLQMEESIQGFLHTSLPRNVKTDVTAILKDAECQNDAARYWNRSGKASGYVENIPAFKNDLYDGKGISYWNSGPENNRMLVWQETQPIRPGKYRFTAYAAGGTWSGGNVNSGNNGGLYLFINDQSVEITTETFGVYSVEAEIPSNETNITVGLKAGDHNTVTWAILAQTHLEYLGTSDITSTFLKDAACQDGTNRYWERSGSASGYIENIPAFHSAAYNGAGVSYWTGAPETGKNLIWQKTQAVLPGKYRFSAFAAGCVWGNKNQNLGYDGELYLFINGQKTALTSSTFNRYTVEIEISSEGTELTVGLQAGEKNTATWAIIAQTRLEYLGNEAILKETDTQYGIAKDTYANVVLERSLVSGKWNTFCVPFDMTAGQVAENGLGEVRRLVEATQQDGNIVLRFDKAETIEAGQPYLVRPTGNVTEIKADEVYLHAGQPNSSTVDGVSMTGNYAATTVPQGAYFINDDKFYLADTDKVNLKGFRAYINADQTTAMAGVNRLLIDIDGKVTNIEEITSDGTKDSKELVDVYTINGIKIKNDMKRADALEGLEHGIYIIDGEKIIK